MATTTARPTLANLQKQAMALLSLAQDRSDTGRAVLVFELYDVCFAGADLSPSERAVAIDLLLAIVQKAEVHVRRALADRLSRDEAAPMALVRALAVDEAAVAYPLLMESSVLQDADLIDIIRDMTLEHQLGIAQRENISEGVSSAFVETGDMRVMRWVVENPGAKISHDTMATIVEASHSADDLQLALVARPDLPIDLAEKMREWIAPELRDRLTETLEKRAAASAVAQRADPPESGALKAAFEIRKAGALRAELLLKALRANRIVEFEALLARFLGVSMVAVRRMLGAAEGTLLASCLKAQGLDKNTFAMIFMLNRKARQPGTVVPVDAINAVTSAFDRLTADQAAKRLAAVQASDPE